MIKKKIYKILKIKGPKTNTLFYDGIGRACRLVKENAATWKGMEYTYSYYLSDKNTLQNFIDRIYLNCLNAQSLRNRLRLIKVVLKDEILKLNKKEVNIISLACGKAEDLISTISYFKDKGIIINAVLIDFSEEALESAKRYAKEKNVEEQIRIECKNLEEIEGVAENFRPDIIEMMGFLEYIENQNAIELMTKIKNSLKEDGTFITCNIAPNIEEYFLEWVINWKMIHRTPNEVFNIAKKAGFSNKKMIYEPLKIHGILIAKK